jgi:hypothetical protein
MTRDATSHRTANDMTDLERRWNRAASSVGICGSEFHNDPEAVFARVREIMLKHRSARLEVSRLRREVARRAGCA